MNTSSDAHRHGRSVDDEVADLTEEVVLVGIPISITHVSQEIL